MALEELSRYRITGKLGEGAMGVVYRAFDPLLERIVAVKTIKLDFSPAEEEDFERRFFREAKSAARLNHPNIVTVYDAGKSGDVAYIAMEFLEGRDLRQLMVKKQTLPLARIVEIAAAVADGLAYAHANGVVHRDIKPANIMVLDNGGLKIADFGIAQIQTGTRTMSDMIVGTSKYMSPEHIMGLPVDGRTDIFSLGVVLYQLLTGVAPFEGDTVTTIMYRVIHEAAALPSVFADGIPAGFEYILAKALAKRPDNRYQSAAEMASDLRNYEALASTPRLPWTIGGIADEAPPAPCAAPSIDLANGAHTVFSEDTIRVNPPGTGLLLESSPASEPTSSSSVHAPVQTSVLPTAIDGASASPKLRRRSSSAFRLIFAASGILILVGAGALLFSEDKKPVNPDATAPSSISKAEPAKVEPVIQPPAPVVVGTATLTLAIAPWGEVFVDGESRGVSPPMVSLEVAAGKRQIEVKNDGASSYSTEIEFKAGEVKRLKYKF